MGLIYKDNAPVKFIEGDYIGHNSRDCFVDNHDFCQLVERADDTQYQVEVTAFSADLISDGIFVNACGVDWTCGANWNIGLGLAEKTGGGANSITQVVQIANNRYYRITFNLIAIANANLTLNLGGNLVATYTPASALGVQTEWIQLAGITDFLIDFAGQAANATQIDDVTLFEYSQIGYEIEDTDGTSIVSHVGTADATRFDETSMIDVDWTIANIPNEGCYVVCNHDIVPYVEQVFNSNFIADELWTKGAGWTIAGGAANWDGSVDDDLTQTFLYPLLSGRSYLIGEIIANHLGGTLTVVLQPSGIVVRVITGNGIFSDVVDLTGFPNQTSIEYQAVAGVPPNDFDITFTNVQMEIASFEEDACSECYELADDWDVHNICTYLLEWTNDENAFGFEYVGLGFTQVMRLQSQLWKPHYPEERSEYEDSQGEMTLLFGKSVKVYDFFVAQVPDYIHDALRLMRIHDDIELNGVDMYAIGGDYEVDWVLDTEEGRVIIELRLKTENNVNNNC